MKNRTRRQPDPPRGTPFKASKDRLASWCLAAMTALFVATPLIPSESAATQGTGVVLVMMWIVLLLVWTISRLHANDLGIRFGPTGVAFVLFLTLHSVSGVVMAQFGHPRPTLNMLWQWISFGIAFFLARQLVRKPAERRAMISVMVGLAVLLSMIGYYQYFVSLPETRLEFEKNPERALANAGIVAPEGSPERKQFEDRLRSSEPIATFTLTNSLAGFLSAWMLVALGVMVSGWSDPSARLRVMLVCGATVALIAVCWILTKSRTAWLATIFGVGLIAIYARRGGWKPDWKWIAIPVSGTVLLVVFGVVVGGLDVLVVTESLKSFLYRLEYWQGTAGMIADYPWFGCGCGNFQQYYTAYKLPQASETIADPHNFMLEIWATGGTGALLTFLVLLFMFARQARAASSERVSAPAVSTQAVSKQAASKQAVSRQAVSRQAECDDASTVRYVYWGALAGVGLAFFPCGFLVGYVPELEAVAVGLPVAALIVGLWHAWVLAGRLGVEVLLCAVAVLLVNLLAAGGIGFAGVALSLWLLMALVLNGADAAEAKVAPRAVWIALAIAGFSFVILVHRTAYGPILESDAAMLRGRQNETRRNFRDADLHFLAAADADPFSADPWELLAVLRHQIWLGDPTQEHFDAFSVASDRAVQLTPRSSSVRFNRGHQLLIAYRHSGIPTHLAAAIDAYEDAVRLYPNYSRGHAQLAWAYRLSGDGAAAARSAETALMLDGLNPHSEQKLSHFGLVDPGPQRPEDQAPVPAGDAEQIMLRLRKPR